MTAPDLEHVLAASLQRRAEEAMINTDTRAEYDRFEERLADEAPRRRRRAVGGGAFVAAAVTVAAVWVSGLVTNDPAPGPAQPDRTAAERVADDFFAAFAAQDADLTASYLASGSAWPEWRLEMQRASAWHAEYFPEPCQELSTSLAATNVICGFEYHMLGSEELGLGPFRNNAIDLRISDGEVVHVELTVTFDSNGQTALYDTIGAWVRENHPGEWAFMNNTEGYTRAELDRWSRLWDRRIDEYVAEQLNGE
jgi:hypothetical protein